MQWTQGQTSALTSFTSLKRRLSAVSATSHIRCSFMPNIPLRPLLERHLGGEAPAAVGQRGLRTLQCAQIQAKP